MFNVSYRGLISGFREFKERVGRPASGSGLRFEFIDRPRESR